MATLTGEEPFHAAFFIPHQAKRGHWKVIHLAGPQLSLSFSLSYLSCLILLSFFSSSIFSARMADSSRLSAFNHEGNRFPNSVIPLMPPLPPVLPDGLQLCFLHTSRNILLLLFLAHMSDIDEEERQTWFQNFP
jgi:hypothetical protein